MIDFISSTAGKPRAWFVEQTSATKAFLGGIFIVCGIGTASLLGFPLLPRYSGLRWDYGTAIPDWTIWFWAINVLMLGFSAFRPMIGVLGYVVLAYSIQGTEPAYQALYRFGLLHWALAIVVAGILIWRTHNKPATIPPGNLVKFVTCFFLWIGLCYIVAMIAGRDAPPRWNRDPAYFIHCFVMFFLAYSLVRDRQRFSTLVGTIAAVLLFRWVSTPGKIFNESYLASYLALIFPLALAGVFISERIIIKAFYAITTVAIIVLVFHIQNRAAVLAVAGGLIFYLATSISIRRAYVMSLTVFIVMLLAVPQTAVWKRFEPLMKGIPFTSERILLWKGGVRMSSDYPIFGVGPGQFTNEVHNYIDGIDRSGQPDAHNSFIEVLSETGFIGLVLFVLIVGCAAIHQIRMATDRHTFPWIRYVSRGLFASTISFFIISLFNSRHDLTLFYLLLGCTAAAYSIWRDNRQLVH